MFDKSSLSTEEEVEEEGAGITLADVGSAIRLWSCANHDADRSVAACALAFNTSPDLVREAVEADAWAFLSPDGEADPRKQLVDVDGD